MSSNNSDGETEPLFRDSKPLPTGNSAIMTFMLQLSFMLGSGFLVQAYAVAEAGVAVVIFEWAIVIFATYSGNSLLVQAMDHKQVYNYCDLLDCAFGLGGSVLVNFSVVLQSAGMTVSYFIFMTSIVKALLLLAVGVGGWYTNIYFLTSMVIVVMLPLCAFKEHADMIYTGIGTLILVIFVLVYIMVEAPLNAVDSSELNLGDLNGTLETIGFILLTINTSVCIPNLYKNLDKSSTVTFDDIQLATVLVGSAILLSVGLVGYFSFRESTKVNIISNFSGTPGLVLDVCVLFHLLGYVPTTVVYCRESLFNLLHGQSTEATPLVYNILNFLVLSSLGMLSAGLTVNFGVTSTLSNIINISGGTSATLLGFIFPALLTLKFKPTLQDMYMSYFLLAFGLLAIVFIAYGTYDSS